MDQPPTYLTEDLAVPEELELRDSGVVSGLGAWTRAVIPVGQKMGPFQGVLRASVDDPSCAWEVSVVCLFAG